MRTNLDHQNAPRSSEEPDADSPHDTVVEQGVIATILRFPEAIRHAEGLDANHFYHDAHAKIFTEVFEKISCGETVTAMTLAHKFSADMRDYILKIATAETFTVTLRQHVDQLIELHHRRTMISGAKNMLKELRTGKRAAEAAAAFKGFSDAALIDTGTNQFHDAAYVTEQIINDLSHPPECVSTGILGLDEAMGGGIFTGKAYCFAARKKVGKTNMAVTLSHNLNMQGVKHLFICGEMGEKEIHQRIVARQLEVYPGVFLSKFADRQKLAGQMAELLHTAPRNVIYRNAPGLTFKALKQMVGLAKMKYDIKGFILDYWQLVGGKSRSTTQAEHLGEVAQWIAEIGRTLDIWSITTAQLNQEGNTRNGEGIRLSSDLVLEIHREDRGQGQSWIQTIDTRYTEWLNVGSKDYPGLYMNEKGPFFEDSNISMPPVDYSVASDKPFKAPKKRAKNLDEALRNAGQLPLD